MGGRELRSWDFFTFEHVRAGPTDEDRGHVRMSIARLCAEFCLVNVVLPALRGFS